MNALQAACHNYLKEKGFNPSEYGGGDLTMFKNGKQANIVEENVNFYDAKKTWVHTCTQAELLQAKSALLEYFLNN